MKKSFAALVICLVGVAIFAGDEPARRDIVIRKGFTGLNTYLIVCKGFPKEGTGGVSRTGTAREAALMNAQFIARDIFNATVDPVRNGLAKKFTDNPDYSVVHYEITKNNLRYRLKSRKKSGGR